MSVRIHKTAATRWVTSLFIFIFFEKKWSQLGGPWTMKCNIFFFAICNLQLITGKWEATEPGAAGRNLSDALRKWAPAHLLHVPLPGLPGRTLPFPIPTNTMLRKVTKLPHTTRGIQGILKFYWKSKKKFYQTPTKLPQRKKCWNAKKESEKIILSL